MAKQKKKGIICYDTHSLVKALIPKAIHKKLRMKCIEKGTTIQKVIEDAIVSFVKR